MTRCQMSNDAHPLFGSISGSPFFWIYAIIGSMLNIAIVEKYVEQTAGFCCLGSVFGCSFQTISRSVVGVIKLRAPNERTVFDINSLFSTNATLKTYRKWRRATASHPRLRISLATFSSPSSERAMIATAWKSAPSRMAVARPIPRRAPVFSASRPLMAFVYGVPRKSGLPHAILTMRDSPCDPPARAGSGILFSPAETRRGLPTGCPCTY